MSHFSDYGFDDVVEKPFMVANLARALKNVLKKELKK